MTAMLMVNVIVNIVNVYMYNKNQSCIGFIGSNRDEYNYFLLQI